MAKITIDQLAGMMQDEFLKVHEKFTSIDQRFTSIDQRFTSIDQKFALTGEKIDNLASGTKKEFSKVHEKIDNLTGIVEWIATELKTLKQELVFNQAAHDRYEARILALEKDINLVKAQLKK